MRPTWTPDLIDELRQRVVAHNGEARLLGLPPVKLGELKKCYERGYKRSNPAQRAMSRVDSYLGGLLPLSKAETFDAGKHPRSQRGQFTGASLPETEAAHRQLQTDNAGYRAWTSAAVPEHRYEEAGGVALGVGSAGLGLALTASLVRGHPNGLLMNAAKRFVGGLADRTALGVSGAVMLPAVGASKLAGRIAGRMGMPRVAARVGAFDETAMLHVARKAGDFGGKIGRAGAKVLVDRATKGARFGVNKLSGVDMNPAKHSLKDRMKIAAATAALSAVPAGVIAGSVSGTSLDPTMMGRSWDNLSYRIVEKRAGGALSQLDRVHGEMLAELHKAQGEGDLAKALPRLLGIGREVVTGAASLVGAGVGAVAARYGVHAVSHAPFRDADGKFTSRDRAVMTGGALAGAALVGGTVLMALNRRNYGALRALAHFNDARLAAKQKMYATADSSVDLPSASKLASMLDGREAAIKAHVAADAPHQAARAAVEQHSGSSVLHFADVIRSDINNKIAEILQLEGGDAVRVPIGTGKNRRLASLTELRLTLQTKGMRTASLTQGVHDVLASSIDTMTRAELEEATKAARPEMRDAALKWFDHREADIAALPGQLEAHHANIATHTANVATLDKAVADAHDTMMKARINLAAAGAEEKPAAQAAMDLAGNAHSEAVELAKTARSALGSLSEKAPPITSRVTGRVIAPATTLQKQSLLANLDKGAAERAGVRADEDINRARNAHLAHIGETRTRNMAALSEYGGRFKAIPKSVRAASASLHEADVAWRDATFKHTAATVKLATCQREWEVLRPLLKGTNKSLAAHAGGFTVADLKPRPKKGYAVSDAEVTRLLNNSEETRNVLAGGPAEVADRLNKLAIASGDRARAAETFHAALAASGPVPKTRVGSARKRRMINELRRDMRDLTESMRGPAGAFLRNPTMQRLTAFANAAGDKAAGQIKSGYVGGKKAVGSLYDAMLTVPGTNGGREFSPSKALYSGALVSGAASAVGGYGLYAHNWLKGTPEQRRKAKVPRIIHYHKERDPLTGAGYVALSLPDEDAGKGERQVLWGATMKDQFANPVALVPGGRVSTLQSKMKEVMNNNRQGGGGTIDLNLPQADAKIVADALKVLENDKKLIQATIPNGPSFTYQAAGASGADGGNRVLNHLRNGRLKNNNNEQGMKGDGYYAALRDVFMAKQSPILTLRNINQALHGYKGAEGPHSAHVFKKNSDYAGNDQDSIVEALSSEISRVGQEAKPSSDAQRDLLHRAVEAVALSKQLGTDAKKGLHDSIDKLGESAAGFPDSAAGFTSSRPIDMDAPTYQANAGFDNEVVVRHAEDVGKTLGPALSLNTRPDREALVEMTRILAQVTHTSNRDFTEQEAVDVAHRAIAAVATRPKDKTLARDAIREIDPGGFRKELEYQADQVRKMRVAKSADYDDFEILLKSFGQDVVNNAGHVLSGPNLTRETVDSGLDVGAARARKALAIKGTGKPQAWYSPVRLAQEGGSVIGGDLAWSLAAHWLPKVALGVAAPEVEAPMLAAEGAGALWTGARALLGMGAKKAAAEGGEAIAGKIAGSGAEAASEGVGAAFGGMRGKVTQGLADLKTNVGHLMAMSGRQRAVYAGKKLVYGLAIPAAASYAGGSVAAAGLGAAVRGGYALAGKKAPLYTPPENGNAGAATIGGLGGAAVGTAFGGAIGQAFGAGGALPGRLIGSALGNFAGTTAAGSYFSGHDPAKVARATQRYAPPTPPAQPAQPKPVLA